MKIQPPKHLSKPAKEWFTKIRTEYGIDDAGGIALLTQAADAWDRARLARELIAIDGAVVRDRFNQSVAHPAVRIETAARAQVLLALKQLNLDIEPLKRPGRPGIGGYQGHKE